MALLTLAKLMDQCLLEIPGKEQAAIVYAVNRVIRRIHTDTVEPQRTTFTTRPQATTGTVAIAQDATLATFTGLATALAATDPVTLVQIDGDPTWFPLVYASASTGNLSSKWAEATVAAATFTLVYPTISFPNTVGEILSVSRAGLYQLPFRAGGGCPARVGTPESWSPYRHDEATAAPSDDLTRIWLDPAPDSRIAYEVWQRPRTPALDTAGATSQTVPFTDLWEDAVVEGTLAILWAQESKKDKALVKNALFEQALARSRGSAQPAGVIGRTNRIAPSGSDFGWIDRRPIGG